MASSQLHLMVTLLYLAMTAGIICGRSHMVLNSALQASHGSSADEETLGEHFPEWASPHSSHGWQRLQHVTRIKGNMPERYSLSELEWLLSNSDPAVIQPDSSSLGSLDLMRRETKEELQKKNGCKNYFWKSRTAC